MCSMHARSGTDTIIEYTTPIIDLTAQHGGTPLPALWRDLSYTRVCSTVRALWRDARVCVCVPGFAGCVSERSAALD